MKRYYIAYGSNLNVGQMRMRCPHATILGTANLKNWELLFKGSKTGSYLTIEECEGGTVPVVIWEVTATDEAALDRYEGFPNFYYKRDIRLQYKGIRTGKRRTVTAFAYIMHEDRPIGIPSNLYMRICLEGYDTFCFDKNVLVDAYDKCREVCLCGRAYHGAPALSRENNETLICPDCGTRQALQSIGVKPSEQEQILETIHRHMGRPPG